MTILFFLCGENVEGFHSTAQKAQGVEVNNRYRSTRRASGRWHLSAALHKVRQTRQHDSHNNHAAVYSPIITVVHRHLFTSRLCCGLKECSTPQLATRSGPCRCNGASGEHSAVGVYLLRARTAAAYAFSGSGMAVAASTSSKYASGLHGTDHSIAHSSIE